MIYPKGEKVWVSYYTEDNKLRFIITSKQARDIYFLYEADGDKFKRLGKSKSPLTLEEQFNVYDKLKE